MASSVQYISGSQRIDDIIKRKRKERRLEAARQAQKEAIGDYSHLKNKKGELIAKPLPQPTLPNLSIDDEDDASSMNTRVAPSTYTKDYYNYQSDTGGDYPPMPAYNPYSAQQPPGNYPHYNPSSATLSYDEPMYPYKYDDDNESTANLTTSAAPFARDPVDRHGSPYIQTQNASYDPRDVYQGRAGSTAPQQQAPQYGRRSPPSSLRQVPSGLAYDDPSDYPSPSQYSQSPTSFGPPQGEDPYAGYSSPANTMRPQQYQGQGARGRNHDEEIGGYGRGQGGPHHGSL